MKKETPEIVITEDGSKTLYLPKLNEHYHSSHGALQESRHIFIESGFKTVASRACSLTVLEMGFGTGLNALLTFMEARKINLKKVHYLGVEAFPVEKEQWLQLEYSILFDDKDAGDVFFKMHECPWDLPYFISEKFVLNKIKGDFTSMSFKEGSFDLVYFDAFAPDLQPELWTVDVFSVIYKALRPGGVLVTYSAKGSVKRALQMAGFVIEGLPGPPGKREITRAIRPSAT